MRRNPLTNAISSIAFATAALCAAPTAAQDRDAERALLEQIVEIPTVAGRGEMPRLVALLRSELDRAGFDRFNVQPHDDTETLIARRLADQPSGEGPILLMAHMDVVDADPDDWQNPPFEFREEGGYYLGRGVRDNKAGLTSMVLAMQRLEASGFTSDRDLIILFTGDEETLQNGARLAASEWRELIEADVALNSDGGGGSVFRDGRVEGFFVQIAEKTYADFQFRVTNRGGHSSRPRPDNAIYQLAAALTAVERYRFPHQLNDATRISYEMLAANDSGFYGQLVRNWLDDPDNAEVADLIESLEPGQTRTRCVATEISGGHAPNALPQSAEATVNCRIFPGTPVTEIQQVLQTIAGQHVEVSLMEGSGAWSDPSPIDETLFAAYSRALAVRFPDAPIIPFMSAGATDAIFTRAAGIPTYGIGGTWGISGEASGAHGLDERVLVEGFHDGVDIWEALLRDLAGAE